MTAPLEYKIAPYAWQHDLIAMSDRLRDVAILADMGTGKTGGTINVLRLRYKRYGGFMKTLIISPLVTLYNWKNEFEKHSQVPMSRVHVLTGDSAKKLKALKRAIESHPCQVIIANYEVGISEKIMDVLSAWRPDLMVFDEAHRLKNHQGKASKAFMHLAMGARHRYILTGTPVANKLMDIFQQYRVLDGGETFGTNFYSFRTKYMMDENARWSHLQSHFPKWVPIPEMYGELHDKIYSKAIRVMKKDCLDLPPYIHEVYPIELSPKQRKYYDDMVSDYLAYIDEARAKGVTVAQTALTKALRLQQIVTGFVKLDDGTEVEIEDNPRMVALEELISSLHEQHKIIVWCSFKNNYKQIGRLLTKLKIPHVFITGDQDLEEKEAAMQAFNTDPVTRVAVCNRLAAGIGVNLVASDFSIVYSRNFSLTEELQSTDRNYRGGSEIHEKITRIDLCAMGTIDEDVTLALKEKKEVADSVIDMVRQRRN